MSPFKSSRLDHTMFLALVTLLVSIGVGSGLVHAQDSEGAPVVQPFRVFVPFVATSRCRIISRHIRTRDVYWSYIPCT